MKIIFYIITIQHHMQKKWSKNNQNYSLKNALKLNSRGGEKYSVYAFYRNIHGGDIPDTQILSRPFPSTSTI